MACFISQFTKTFNYTLLGTAQCLLLRSVVVLGKQNASSCLLTSQTFNTIILSHVYSKQLFDLTFCFCMYCAVLQFFIRPQLRFCLYLLIMFMFIILFHLFPLLLFKIFYNVLFYHICHFLVAQLLTCNFFHVPLLCGLFATFLLCVWVFCFQKNIDLLASIRVICM